MENIKKFFSQLKYELSLWFDDNKYDYCIAICVVLGFLIAMFGLIIFAALHTEIFMSIVLVVICCVAIVLTEENLETDYYHTKYPLLKQIKHGFIRYVLYPIYVSITCLMVYALLFH